MPTLTGYCSEHESLKVRQRLVSGIGLDSGVAIGTSRDWLMIVTQADSAFALPVSYVCDGC